MPNDRMIEADVAIIGAGAAGMMAALVAANSKARVVLLDKDLQLPCSTQLSGGILMAAGTPQQEAAKIVDSPESYANDIQEYNGHQSDPELTLALCRRSASVVEFLSSATGLEFRVDTDYPYQGHSVHRGHATGGGGAGIVAAMRAAVSAHEQIEVLDCYMAKSLDSTAGAVHGLSAQGPDPVRIRSRSVVVASGGFEGNKELIGANLPEMSGLPFIGAEKLTGDGIKLATELGATTEHMGSYLAHSHVVIGGTQRLPGAIPLRGGILVNLNGRRFAAEDLSPPRFAPLLLKQVGAVALEIFDRRIADLVRGHGPNYVWPAGCIQDVDSVGELARRFDIDSATVEAEVDAYNGAVATRHDWLGRTTFEEPLRPPFFGALVTVGLACTQGGLKINSQGQVLTSYGTPIRNLFAAGGACAGLSGHAGSTGYLPGNGLLMALGLGAIVGERCAVAPDSVQAR
jgi:succinate dehydrogenase/fumarate reductase flavoprotein subunit